LRSYTATATTMQALVKYHGLKNWKLRLPYHDSVSVNTTSMMTKATLTFPSRQHGVYIGGRYSDSATSRLKPVLEKLAPNGAGRDFRIDSSNLPRLDAKGLGYSSSAGAALTLLCYSRLVGRNPDLEKLSRVARLFAASAARSLVGGFSRLHVGETDDSCYASRFADEKTMDLRMAIVPLPLRVRTEDAHREVEASPFFEARVRSAQKRCEEMEKAILGNDLRKLGELTEQDTLELHAITMTGASRLMLMTEDSIRVIRKVKQLRNDGVEAYFSMQTGPTVYINTSQRHLERVLKEVLRLGYRAYSSGVGGEARMLT
jgi:phosphomevalonate decarboxylase